MMNIAALIGIMLGIVIGVSLIGESSGTTLFVFGLLFVASIFFSAVLWIAIDGEIPILKIKLRLGKKAIIVGSLSFLFLLLFVLSETVWKAY